MISHDEIRKAVERYDRYPTEQPLLCCEFARLARTALTELSKRVDELETELKNESAECVQLCDSNMKQLAQMDEQATEITRLNAEVEELKETIEGYE